MDATEIQSVTVIGYKAFNDDMTCMNKFQYEVDKTYTINANQVEICQSGFHFCMFPIDVLKYYEETSKFAIIKASGKIIHDYDKSVCSQITIEKLITLNELYNLTNGKIVRNNGDIEYYQNGQHHRLDGPSIEQTDGRKEWYKNGELHREDGPAIEYPNGFKAWFENGKRHRLDGPAIEHANGDKEWFKNGKRHRLDGPAIEYPNRVKAWYKNGEQYVPN